jgi:hypothetical protein
MTDLTATSYGNPGFESALDMTTLGTDLYARA